jgi:hypothetical protein
VQNLPAAMLDDEETVEQLKVTVGTVKKSKATMWVVKTRSSQRIKDLRSLDDRCYAATASRHLLDI